MISYYLVAFVYFTGPYVVEPIREWWWAILSLGVLYFIYWIPVQGLCIVSIASPRFKAEVK